MGDAGMCQKLMDFAKMAHLRTSEVIKAVREAIIEHASNAQEIFQKAMDFLTGEITCEGIFGADVCSKLQKAAQMLGEKAEVINAAIREAVSKHLTKISDILNFVQEKMVDLATDFKCEKVLSADMCATIDKIGGHFKDSIDVVNKAIKEAIVHGATGVQEIYNVAIAWLRDHVKASKCEDLISADVCRKIRDFANKVHVSAKDVLQAVKEAIASGVTKVTELYKVVVKYIMDRWTDLIGDEEMLALSESSDELILPGLREALEKVVDKVLNDLKVKSDDIRAMIKKVIMEGKIRIAEIKQKIKDLLAEIGSQDDQMFQMNKQELVEKLKEALKKAKGMSKILIEKLMKMSKEQLAKAKALIKMILDKYGMQQDSFIDVLLDSTHEQILKDMETETTAFSDMIVEDMINEADLL